MFKYKTGTYVVISHNGTPVLLGKVTRKRGNKAEVRILNHVHRVMTFDEIGLHHKPGATYLVEGVIDLPEAIRAGVHGDDRKQYVEAAISLFVRPAGPDDAHRTSSFDDAIATMQQTDDYKEAIRFAGDKAHLRAAFYEVAHTFYQLGLNK